MSRFRSPIPLLSVLGCTILLLLLPAKNQLIARQEISGLDNLNFLPILVKEHPRDETLFGIHSQSDLADGALDLIDNAGASWVRPISLDWASVEPTEGARNWGAVSALESQLVAARNMGLEVSLVVKKTPAWAQAIPPYSCGKIKPDKLGAFAAFMHDAVSRYNDVTYWEIWNEPDVEPSQVPHPDSGYGCWGEGTDPYFGGGYFGTMLAAVYPQVKAADPGAQVIIGGLLLDCDPGIPGGCASQYGNLPSRFLEGILSQSGGSYFDGVAYHAYDFYMGGLGTYENQNWGSQWNVSGPLSSTKRNYVLNLLNQYAVTGKHILNTENALVCETCSQDPSFETTKAYYLIQSYAASIHEGLKANIWYSILGWRNSGLLNPDHTPRPAYTAFQVARQTLQNAAALGTLTSADISPLTGIKGYKFSRNGKEIWVVWSLDGAVHPVSLPVGSPDQVINSSGQLIFPTSTPSISIEPLFLVWY